MKKIDNILILLNLSLFLFSFIFDIFLLKEITGIMLLIFSPGYLVLKNIDYIKNIDFLEAIFLSIGISISLLIIIPYFSKLILPTTNYIHTSFFVISLFVLISSLYNFKKSENNPKKRISKKTIFLFIFLILLSVSLPIDDIISSGTLLGSDSWNVIPNSLELQNTYSRLKGMNGHGVFLSIISKLFGIYTKNPFMLIKYLGPIYLMLCSGLIFLIFRKLINVKTSFFISFFFITSEWIIKRFQMPIRENFCFIVFLTFLFILVFYFKNDKKDIIILYLTYIASLLTHPIIWLMCTGSLIILIIFKKIKIFQNSNKRILPIFYMLIITNSLLPIFAGHLINKIKFQLNLLTISPNFYYILFSVVIISFILFFLKKTKFKKTFFLKRKVKLTILILIYVILLLGSIYSMSRPTETNEIVGTWNPKISLDYFSIGSLFFLPLGALYILKLKQKKDENTLKYLLPIFALSFFILIMLNLPNIGGSYPIFRMGLYLTFLVSILSGLGLSFFIKKLGKNKSKIIITTLIAIIIIFSIISALNARTWREVWSDEKIEKTLEFKNLQENYPGIIIPQKEDIRLLITLGFENIEKNTTVRRKIFTSSSKKHISKIIENNYPNRTIYLFMSHERQNNYTNYPNTKISRKLLNEKSIYSDTLLVFKFESLDTKSDIS